MLFSTRLRRFLKAIAGKDKAPDPESSVELILKDIADRANYMSSKLDTLDQFATYDSIPWQIVKANVRAGFGPDLYPVGYEFKVWDKIYERYLVFVVVAHDHFTAVDPSVSHTMTLALKNAFSDKTGAYIPVQFDAPEAFYAVSGEPLAAGTYCFTETISAYPFDTGAFNFELPVDAPVGAYFIVSDLNNYSKSGFAARTITVYNPDGTVLADNIQINAGEVGTPIVPNSIYRFRNGSHNYAQSAARQFLLSDAEAGKVWEKQTAYDMPPSWANKLPGFQASLPKEFLDILEPCEIPCRTNNYFEVPSLDGTSFDLSSVYKLHDKIFLLSTPEVFGTYSDATIRDGELLDFYDGATGGDRIKRDESGNARDVWLRTPNPTVISEYYIYSYGSSDSNSPSNGNCGVFPAGNV